MGNLRLASHGDMGPERYEGQPGTGPFGAVLADDSLLTIKTPLRAVRSAGVACRITRLPTIPQPGLTISLTSTLANLRLAARGEMGHGRERQASHRFCLSRGGRSGMPAQSTPLPVRKACSDAYGLGFRPTIAHYGGFQNGNTDVVTRDIARM
ncbi:hypothetical protein MTO96_012762 [Rhipicephalus appendiculatus]